MKMYVTYFKDDFVFKILTQQCGIKINLSHRGKENENFFGKVDT